MNSRIASEKIVQQLSNVRRRKIKRLKTKITSGKYRIDNLSLAKALFLSR
ncbi:MAG: flagellar biosynthesis anti-sigma factor FlgM [Oligoflexia bacterium]|nr:flagellar biosynthesis anti-sigma factor FlgM [Oligoflexia bacterium]